MSSMSHKFRRRWGDNDIYFGPFTFSFKERWRHFAILLGSGDDEYPGCNLRISAFGNTVIVGLPKIIKPYQSWVDLSNREWATADSEGRKGYYQFDEREYGFTLSEGHLSIHYGRQTNDSRTEKHWGCFLPWTQWRQVRHSYYGVHGEHLLDVPGVGESYADDPHKFDREMKIREEVPCVSFYFYDFDGEMIIAKTKIEERENRLGTGWFKWLSKFTSPKIRRCLDIDFSKETGKQKGSWKGGILGTGITMLPDELHEAAFRRYCENHSMEFIAPVGEDNG